MDGGVNTDIHVMMTTMRTKTMTKAITRRTIAMTPMTMNVDMVMTTMT